MRLSIISFTLSGSLLAKKMHLEWKDEMFQIRRFAAASYAQQAGAEPLNGTLGEWTGRQFGQADGIIFVGAAGIAVRAIAPFLQDKTKDPAVVVVDEKGQYAIPVLSGHIGGANELAGKIADCLGAVPVITTATDINHEFAVDMFAKKNRLFMMQMEYAKEISAAVLNHRSIGLDCHFDIKGKVPDCFKISKSGELGVCISFHEEERPFSRTLNLIPKTVTLGIGCRRGKTLEEIERAVWNLLKELQISFHAISRAATIDLKKDEEGLLAFCSKYNLPLEFYTAEQLEQAPGDFQESDYVKSVTGVGNVCERAAIMGMKEGSFLQRKIAGSGITLALAAEDWSVYFE